MGAKLGANGRSPEATPGHNKLASLQLNGPLSDTRPRPDRVPDRFGLPSAFFAFLPT
jgi:hypothetical protein